MRSLSSVTLVALSSLAMSSLALGASAPTPGTNTFPTAAPAPLFPTATAPAAHEDEQDMLSLTNGQSIYGTIATSSDATYTEINTGSGVVRLPTQDVKQRVLGLQSQRTRIAQEPLADLVAFARWCDARGHRLDALAALDRAVTLPGVDIETIGLHAQLVDETPSRGPKEALPLYRQYQAAGGDKPEILARLTQLEGVLSDNNKRREELGMAPLDPSQSTASSSITRPAADVAAPEGTIAAGLESKGTPFQSEELQWSLPSQASLITLPTAEGGYKVLAVTSPGKPAKPVTDGSHVPDKVALKKSVTIGIDEGNSVLALQVRNRSTHPVKLAVALKTSDKWTFYESLPQIIAPNADFKELHYNLKGSTFKSQATKWFNTGSVADLDQVKEIQLLFYNEGQDVDIQILGMQLIKDPEL